MHFALIVMILPEVAPPTSKIVTSSSIPGHLLFAVKRRPFIQASCSPGALVQETASHRDLYPPSSSWDVFVSTGYDIPVRDGVQDVWEASCPMCSIVVVASE